MQPEIIFYIIVLIFSIVLHEIAHGYAALVFKDRTAYYAGRLTLNPIPHLDLFGSIILPVLLVVTQSPLLAGWAKPVPITENNLIPYKLGKLIVAVAGIGINLVLVLVFLIIGSQVSDLNLKNLLAIIVSVNLSLAIFNLLPFPPMDGYRIIESLFSFDLNRKINIFINSNFILIILLSIFIASFIFNKIFPQILGFTLSFMY